MKTIFSFLVALLFIFGCKNSKETVKRDLSSITEVKQISVDKTFTPDIKKQINYTIQNVSISGDIINIDVSYSGGCKEHSFQLTTNGLYAKSNLPKINLYLSHNNNEDMCKKMIEETIHFDIKQIQTQSKSIIILLNNHQNQE